MDREQMTDAILAHRVSMLRLALSVTGSGPDAEDAVSAATERALLSARRMRQPERVKSYLLTAAYRAAVDILRRRKREFPSDTLPEESCPFESLTGTVYETIAQLPRAYREVLVLYYYEGYSAKEIAGMMGSNVSRVTTQLSRGRQKLRELLEGGEEE